MSNSIEEQAKELYEQIGAILEECKQKADADEDWKCTCPEQIQAILSRALRTTKMAEAKLAEALRWLRMWVFNPMEARACVTDAEKWLSSDPSPLAAALLEVADKARSAVEQYKKEREQLPVVVSYLDDLSEAVAVLDAARK
jgi:hypothetical protein